MINQIKPTTGAGYPFKNVGKNKSVRMTNQQVYL